MGIWKTAANAGVALAAAGLATTASATTFFFDFASNDGTDAAFGTLDATSDGNGTFTATSGSITTFGPVETGSGTLTSNPAARAASLSPSGFFIYDDQLLPGQNPLITNPGLLFEVGGHEINIYSNGPGPGTYEIQTNAGGTSRLGNFVLTEAVPEPAAWALMLTGFGLVGVTARRGRRAPAA